MTFPLAGEIPKGSLFLLISQFFAYDDNLDSVDMTLLSGYYKVTADSVLGMTAVAILDSVYIHRYATALFGAICLAIKSDCIGRSGAGLDALDRLVKVFNYLIVSANKHNALGTVEYSGDTVGVTVYVIKITALCNRV